MWLFKIVDPEAWSSLTVGSRWPGTQRDAADGFIHLSTAAQVPGTLARHYPGRPGLRLLWLRSEALDEAAVRFESSRGGDLFPHLYATLDLAQVERVDILVLGPDGTHRLPPDLDTTPGSTPP